MSIIWQNLTVPPNCTARKISNDVVRIDKYIIHLIIFSNIILHSS